jgi:hypothetical protein
MSSIFCCSSLAPYRHQFLDHESKFTSFKDWAAFPKTSSIEPREGNSTNPLSEGIPSTYVIQIVRQVNYGPLESRRYFASCSTAGGMGTEPFVEVEERDLIEANFEKVNS